MTISNMRVGIHSIELTDGYHKFVFWGLVAHSFSLTAYFVFDSVSLLSSILFPVTAADLIYYYYY